MTHQEAASLLGVPEREVSDVQDSKHGPVITTTDGVSYILVDSEAPDASGKAGLMYLQKPNPRYEGVFPVFAASGQQKSGILASLGIEPDDDEAAEAAKPARAAAKRSATTAKS